MSYLPRERARVGALSGGLLAKVFGLLAFSLAFAVLGGAVGARYAQGWLLPLVLLEFGLLIGVMVARDHARWNLPLLYAFTFVSGMTVGPLIALYVGAGLGVLVVQALLITAVMTAGLSAYALTTRRDFSGLAPYLFIALLGLVVAGIIGVFVGGTLLHALLGWAGAVIFSLLLVWDVQRARSADDTMGNAVAITLGVYLDIVNLFLAILRILTYLSGSSRK